MLPLVSYRTCFSHSVTRGYWVSLGFEQGQVDGPRTSAHEQEGAGSTGHSRSTSGHDSAMRLAVFMTVGTGSVLEGLRAGLWALLHGRARFVPAELSASRRNSFKP